MGWITNVKDNVTGFVRPNRDREVKALNKALAYEPESVTSSYQRKALKEAQRTRQDKIYEQEYLKAFKSKSKIAAQKKLGTYRPPKGSSIRENLKSQFKTIGRSQSFMVQDNARMPVPQPREDRNFFEHKDEMEVYGDEGLTFFDSNKPRARRRTGSMFGI